MINGMLIAAALVSPASTHTDLQPENLQTWAEFARYRGRGGLDVSVRISVSRGPADNVVRYWATQGYTSDTVNSDGCPAILTIVEGMKNIELPAKITVPDPDLAVTIADGVTYSLTATYSSHPAATVSTDMITIQSGGGPLCTWIDNALIALEPCWPAK